MENTNELRMVNERGWPMGFANLFHEANGSFWRTRTWLVQVVLWLIMLNGMFAIFLWKTPPEVGAETVASIESLSSLEAIQQDLTASAFAVFLVYCGMGLPIAAIIFGQDAIIGERQSGTAAWVLSKPVSRPAFILSRLLARTIGILVTGVVIQGVIAYIQVSFKIGAPWPIAAFWGAMSLVFLNFIFYLTLTFMLGTIFKSRGPVLGIGLAMAIVGPAILAKMLPFCNVFTPWSFLLPVSEDMPLGLALAFGQPLASVTPIVGTVLACLVFTVVAILRFRREEF